MSKPRMTRPPARYVSAPHNERALRRRAEAYREKANELETMLKDTQDQFTESFAAADLQVSTRERINAAARKGRRLGGRSV